MIEEEDKTQDEQADEAAPEAAPEEPTPDEAPAEEPAVEEAPAEPEPEADDAQPEADPGAPGGEAEEAPGSDSEEPTAAAPEEPAEPEEVLSPKALRKRERSQHAGEAKPQRSVEERAAERAAQRKAASEARRRSRARARSKHQPGEGTPPAEHVKGSKKVRQGTVVSSKADKTITVRIEVVRRHPQYEKIVRQTATIHAHDEANDANEGDIVRVIESRPLSRLKRWRLVEVLERAR